MFGFLQTNNRLGPLSKKPRQRNCKPLLVLVSLLAYNSSFAQTLCSTNNNQGWQIPADQSITNITIDFPDTTGNASKIVPFIDLEHNKIGHLSASVLTPSNNTVELFDRPGAFFGNLGCSNTPFEGAFSPNASTKLNRGFYNCAFINEDNTLLSGEYAPLNNSNQLKNKNPTGLWQFEITNHKSADPSGSLPLKVNEVCINAELPEANFTSSFIEINDVNGGLLEQNDLLEFTVNLINSGNANANISLAADITAHIENPVFISSINELSVQTQGGLFGNGAFQIANRAIRKNKTFSFTYQTTVQDFAPNFAAIKQAFSFTANNSSTLYSPTILINALLPAPTLLDKEITFINEGTLSFNQLLADNSETELGGRKSLFWKLESTNAPITIAAGEQFAIQLDSKQLSTAGTTHSFIAELYVRENFATDVLIASSNYIQPLSGNFSIQNFTLQRTNDFTQQFTLQENSTLRLKISNNTWTFNNQVGVAVANNQNSKLTLPILNTVTIEELATYEQLIPNQVNKNFFNPNDTAYIRTKISSALGLDEIYALTYSIYDQNQQLVQQTVVNNFSVANDKIYHDIAFTIPSNALSGSQWWYELLVTDQVNNQVSQSNYFIIGSDVHVILENQAFDATGVISIDNANIGDDVTFKIRVYNHGPADVIDAKVFAEIPFGLENTTSNTPGSSQYDNQVWESVDIPAGQARTLEINSSIANNAPKSISLIANQVSINQDPDPIIDLFNNTATILINDGIDIPQALLEIARGQSAVVAKPGDKVYLDINIQHDVASLNDAEHLIITESLSPYNSMILDDSFSNSVDCVIASGTLSAPCDPNNYQIVFSNHSDVTQAFDYNSNTFNKADKNIKHWRFIYNAPLALTDRLNLQYQVEIN